MVKLNVGAHRKSGGSGEQGPQGPWAVVEKFSDKAKDRPFLSFPHRGLVIPSNEDVAESRGRQMCLWKIPGPRRNV